VPTLHTQRNKNLGRAAAMAVAMLVTALAGVAPAAAATYPDPSFDEELLVGGLDTPVQVTWAPDGRMFIAEKDGNVKVLNPGAPAATTILDLTDAVNSSGDRGLLGIAVDSDYPAHPYLYVAYVQEPNPMMADDIGRTASRIVRYDLAPGPASTLSSPRILLGTSSSVPCDSPPSNTFDCIPADSSTHTIGTIRSAPDGSLFIGTGDGAEFNGVDDRALRSLDERSLAGKVLHVDREGNGLGGHPFCPTNQDLTQNCTKVWAQGFRNPFRFTLRDDGVLVLGDVGWETYEELDLVGGGESYGWPCFEGPNPATGYSSKPTCQALGPQTPPDWGYNRSGQGGAMIGGPTYPGGPYPDEYDGVIFAGDYAQARVTRVSFDGGSVATAPFISNVDFTDLELHPSGDLVYVFPGFAPGAGGVYRVTFDPAGRPTARTTVTGSAFDADPPYTFNFSSTGSTNATGGTSGLSYAWDFGDGATSTAGNPAHTYTQTGPHTVTLAVTASLGKKDKDLVTVYPGNAAPPANLNVVASPALYRDGEPITLTGSADDAETLDWTVLLRHGGHIHPVRSWKDETQITFLASDDHDADSHYEVILTATDAGGASTSKTVSLFPETTTLSLRSVPSGAALTYAGGVFSTPADLTSAVGFRTTISAPATFSTGGREYSFASWSDGGSRLHDIIVPPGGRTIVACYEANGCNPPSPPGDSAKPQTKSDRTAPRLGLTARGIGVRRGVLRGTVRDGSGIRRVQVALARRDGLRCRWWQARAHRPGKRASCATPRWMTARLTHKSAGVYEWRLALHRRLVDGRWQLLLRATDRAGNTATHLPGRGTRLSLQISRGRAALR
jgi:glucose/arabinose dehydrogenase/PKD repeat protein